MGKVSSIVVSYASRPGLAVRRFEGPGDLAVDTISIVSSGHVADGAESVARALLLAEPMPRVLIIEGDDQHRPRRDEAPALVQPLQPGSPSKARRVEMDVHPAEAERDGMDARGRPGRRPEAEAAVEQGVIVLEAEVDPAPLGPAAGVALDVHVLGRGLSVVANAEGRPPDVVVGELVQVDRHDRDQHHRPRPVVLVELDQRPFAMGPLGDRTDRRRRPGPAASCG